MVSPAPDTQPGQAPAVQSPREVERGLPVAARTTGRFLTAYGYHVLAVLLGIALAFM